MNARRRSASVVAVTLGVALALSACTSPSGDQDPGTGAVKEGGVLRIGTSSGLISPNPFVGFNQDDYAVWMQIYPSLLQYDTTTPTYDYIPGFADGLGAVQRRTHLHVPHRSERNLVRR